MSIPPIDDGTPRDSVVHDRTPEPAEVQRTITPVSGSKFGGSRTGAIIGVSAVVAALFFINVGHGSKDAGSNSTMAMSPEAKAHPDQHAAQTEHYDPGQAVPANSAGGPPNLAGTPQGPTRMVTMPDGTVVPAIEPGGPTAAPAGGQGTAETFAEKARRAPMLVGTAGQDRGPVAVSNTGGQEATAVEGQPAAAAAAPAGELDKLRQVSAIGSSHATMLPNRNYLVTAGTLIPCVLQTAMNSTQPGYTSCIVPRDIFSDNGRVVLLEKGTKVLGQYQGGLNQGQNRIFVLWTRAVTPRGVAIELASPASDALGRAGMAGAVDTFFWARFGAALMLSLVDDGTSIASSHLAGQGTNTTNVPSSTASVALQNTINIKPVLKKNQGEEVGIFVAQDFNFGDVYNLAVRP